MPTRESKWWAAIDGRRWQPIRRRVLDLAAYRCQAVGCGKAGRLEVDHVVPLHRGGDAYGMANLQALCVGCHVAKSRRENPRRRPVSAERIAWGRVVAALK